MIIYPDFVRVLIGKIETDNNSEARLSYKNQFSSKDRLDSLDKIIDLWSECLENRIKIVGKSISNSTSYLSTECAKRVKPKSRDFHNLIFKILSFN